MATLAGAAPVKGVRRKIDYRKPLKILREDDLYRTENLDPNAVPVLDNGVDKEEADELHLLQALESHWGEQSNKTSYIPIPEANRQIDDYDQLYPKKFQQSRNLIRFSVAIEDCIGCPYNMDEVDDAWLADYDKRVDRGETEGCRLSEDQFEELMWCLEKLTDIKNPGDLYSRAPHLVTPDLPTLQEFENQLDIDQPLLPPSRNINLVSLKSATPQVYQHWSERKKQRGGKPIAPTIKSEEIAGINDPWVCFRRRNERPQRKTRRVDQSGVDKLRQLRTQLDMARQLLDMTTNRERLRKESLILEELIFQQRVLIRRMRKKLGLPIQPPEEDARKRRKLEDDRTPGKIVIPIEQLKEWAIPPPPLPDEATRLRQEQFELDWNNEIMDFTDPHAMPIPIRLNHPGHAYYRCDLPVPVPVALPSPPESNDEWARQGELAPDSATLRLPMGRVRIGRGGRRIYDRRLRLDQVYPEARVDRHWRAGEREGARDKMDGLTPGVEPLTESQRLQRAQVEQVVDRLKWSCESDDDDDAFVDQGLEQGFEDSSPLLIFRASMLRASEDYVRLFTQSREWLATLVSITPPEMRYPQSRIPPPVVVKGSTPPQPQVAAALQQQLAVVGSNLGAVAQLQQQLRLKQPDGGEEEQVKLITQAAKQAQVLQLTRAQPRPQQPQPQAQHQIAALQQFLQKNPAHLPGVPKPVQPRPPVRPQATPPLGGTPNLTSLSNFTPIQLAQLSSQIQRLAQTNASPPRPTVPTVPAVPAPNNNAALLLQALQTQGLSQAQLLTILAAAGGANQMEEKK